MDYKTRIKEKGFKLKFVAEKLGISDVLFSYYLNDTRPMPAHIKKSLDTFLNA